jgi:hypothetical protein
MTIHPSIVFLLLYDSNNSNNNNSNNSSKMTTVSTFHNSYQANSRKGKGAKDKKGCRRYFLRAVNHSLQVLSTHGAALVFWRF